MSIHFKAICFLILSSNLLYFPRVVGDNTLFTSLFAAVNSLLSSGDEHNFGSGKSSAAFGVQGIFSPSCNLNTNLYIDILTIVDVALVNVKRDWLRNSGVSYGLNGQYFFKLLLNWEGCYQFSVLRQTLS